VCVALEIMAVILSPPTHTFPPPHTAIRDWRYRSQYNSCQ